MGCTQRTAGPVTVQHMGRLAAVAAKRLTSAMNMVAEISAAAKAKQKQRRHYERLAAIYAMVEVRRVIRCVHNRNVENMREEMVQQHWDMYAAGKVTQEWEAQAHWRHQSAGRRMCAHVVGTATRRRVQAMKRRKLQCALTTMVGSQAGRNERLSYRVIAAMVENKRREQHLWGTPTKLSSIYRFLKTRCTAASHYGWPISEHMQ